MPAMTTVTAAGLALVLCVVFGVLGFGWRSWLQHRRTGSAGFRGVNGRVGSVEWIAGVGFPISLVVIVGAPVLQWANLLEPIGPLRAVWIQVIGMVVAVVGIAATVDAQLAMGDSWRIGVDEQETTELVHTGLFGLVRNPIYTAMFTFVAGLCLLTPNLLAFAGFVLLVAAIELHVRSVEEPYLMRKHAAAYRAYAAGVGRFIPGIGRMR
jgi:protein-S-isoprenylcysteine O-methyltransferase Ste14